MNLAGEAIATVLTGTAIRYQEDSRWRETRRQRKMARWENCPVSVNLFLGGMRAGAGLAVAVFVLGLTLGALAPADGWGLIAPLAGTSDGRYRHAVPSTRLMPSGLT